MSKYEILPQQLLHEGTITRDNIFHPEPIDERWVLLTHDETYWQKLKTLTLSHKEARRTGFPLTRELIDREIMIANGTRICTHYALEFGVSMNIAGGTHHAFTNRGEGFCLLNDQAIAANYLLHENLARKVLIVDLDVHQGNGTAEIFGHEPRVFTFSMHGKNNYPLIKEHSDLDIELEDGTTDEPYLSMLNTTLERLIHEVVPDFMFFQSGVDILETDRLGLLSVTRDGCRERDNVVIRTAKRNNIPLVISMGGGYSRDFRDIIEAHANTYRVVQDVFF